MKYQKLIPMVLVLWMNICGQELAFEIGDIDTTIYDPYTDCYAYINIDQLQSYKVVNTFPRLSSVYLNKITNQYDIFIKGEKVSSFSIINPINNRSVVMPRLATQTIFNSDMDWEVLWDIADTVTAKVGMLLCTSGGATIWQSQSNESCFASTSLYYDGTYIYIEAWYNNGNKISIRYYRFHPSISSTNPGLSKSAFSSKVPVPVFSTGYAGDIKIKLAQSPAGATTVSVFNLLGRQLFSQTVPNLKKDITFTIPSQSVPGSPIIGRVQNVHGQSTAKTIPVR